MADNNRCYGWCHVSENREFNVENQVKVQVLVFNIVWGVGGGARLGT